MGKKTLAWRIRYGDFTIWTNHQETKSAVITIHFETHNVTHTHTLTQINIYTWTRFLNNYKWQTFYTNYSTLLQLCVYRLISRATNIRCRKAFGDWLIPYTVHQQVITVWVIKKLRQKWFATKERIKANELSTIIITAENLFIKNFLWRYVSIRGRVQPVTNFCMMSLIRKVAL